MTDLAFEIMVMMLGCLFGVFVVGVLLWVACLFWKARRSYLKAWKKLTH